MHILRHSLPRPPRGAPLTLAPKRATVLGVGNEWRRDDAVGLVVVRRLRARQLPGVRVLERTGDPPALVDAWRDASNVIVVDAAQSSARPGTVLRSACSFTAQRHAARQGTSHGLGVPDAIALAAALGRLPPKLELLSVAGSDFRHGCGLTPAVEAAADRLVLELAARLA